MNRRIWIIGGTSEGRGLVKELAQLDIEIFVSVATIYGAKLIEQHSNVKVLPERMDLAAMQAFIAGSLRGNRHGVPAFGTPCGNGLRQCRGGA